MGEEYNNIQIDEDAIKAAAGKLEELSERMQNLKAKIELLLDELEKGFDTPAGHRFKEACSSELLKRLNDQSNVIQHVSDNLQNTKALYESVFDDYKQMNSIQ